MLDTRPLLWQDAGYMESGTKWVDPGKGATRAEFASALGRHAGHNRGKISQTVQILRDLQVRIPAHKRTNLALTGQPLGPVDLERIASPELKVAPRSLGSHLWSRGVAQ